MTRVRGVFTMLVAVGLLVACSGRFEYVPPVSVETPPHSRVVAKSLEEVWRHAATSPIGGRFAVDGLDKDAGIITLTYSGDPERYVDCGYVTSRVTNVRGERTYRFPAASASVDYELMTGKDIVSIARHMALDAQITLTAEPTASQETRVSATAQYALSRTMHIRDALGSVQTVSHRTIVTSDREGAFPGAVACRANGTLEADVLSAFAR